MNNNSLFWSLCHRLSYCHRECFCLQVHTELYPWDKFWRERKKSKIGMYLFKHLMCLAEGWEGRGTAAVATAPFVTRSTHRESGVGSRSSHALAYSGLLPHLPTQQPVRHCRRAAEGKIERGIWSAGCLKRYSCFHKSQGFPREGGYASACANSPQLLQMQEHLFTLKGLLFPAQGTQPFGPATTSQLKHYRLSQEAEMKMGLPFRHISMVNELSVRKITKVIEERKITNQISIITKPQTLKSWAESLTLLVSHFMCSG